MKELDDIDKLFREQAQLYRAKVPNDSWDKISQRLSIRKKRGGFWLYTSLVAGIIFISGIGYVALNKSNNEKTTHKDLIVKAESTLSLSHEITDNTEISSISQEPKSEIRHAYAVSTNDIKVKSENSAIAKPAKKEIKPYEATKKLKPNRRKIAVSSYTSVVKNEGNPKIQSPILSSFSLESDNETNIENTLQTSQKQENNIEIKQQVDLVKTKDEAESIKIINAVEIGDEAFVDTINSTVKTDLLPEINSNNTPNLQLNKFIAFAFFAGESSSYRTTRKVNPDEEIQAESASDDWLNALQSKFEVKFYISDNLSLSAGFLFGKFGSISTFRVTDDYLKYVKMSEFGIASSGIFNAYRIVSVLNSSNASSVNGIKQFDRIQVVYDYVDYPLNVNYEFGQFWGIKARADLGLNLARIRSNIVSIRKNSVWYELGTVENTREYMFGTNTGLEFAYGLGAKKNFELLLATDYKYYLHSVNLDTEFIYRPYLISVNLGARMIF